MGVHDGHRGRVRAKFIESGLESFKPHEALELLLFYAVPRKDTNELAHRLLARFGSLNGVFGAEIKELCEVEGVSENTAVLIKLIPRLTKKAELTAPKKASQLTDSSLMHEYLRPFFRDEDAECIYVLALDSQLRPITCELLNRGVVNSVDVCVRKVMETALKNKAVHLVLAHNHPDSVASPSQDDIRLTKRIQQAAQLLEIALIDHIIVAEEGYASFADSGLL